MADLPDLDWATTEMCTLPTAERPVRVAEFDELFSRHGVSVTRSGETSATFEFAGDADLANRVRDLAERESSCCSFFDFVVSEPGADKVMLSVSVPVGQTQVLAGLIARAERATTTP